MVWLWPQAQILLSNHYYLWFSSCYILTDKQVSIWYHSTTRWIILQLLSRWHKFRLISFMQVGKWHLRIWEKYCQIKMDHHWLDSFAISCCCSTHYHQRFVRCPCWRRWGGKWNLFKILCFFCPELSVFSPITTRNVTWWLLSLFGQHFSRFASNQLLKWTFRLYALVCMDAWLTNIFESLLQNKCCTSYYIFMALILV